MYLPSGVNGLSGRAAAQYRDAQTPVNRKAVKISRKIDAVS